MALPFRRGDMVWSYFPFSEAPDEPALTRHAAVVIGVFAENEASRLLGRSVPDTGWRSRFTRLPKSKSSETICLSE